MPTYPDTQGYAFSFGNARIKLDNVQYTAVQNIQIDQELEEAAVHGTAIAPLRRTEGQLQLGEGTITFSDYQEGDDFITSLGDKPLLKLFAIDYTLENAAGVVRNIELIACRLTNIGIDHESGPEALPLELPFSFLQMKRNGKELV